MRKFLIGVALLLGMVGHVAAADSTVSSMTGASALDGTELYYGVQGGADRKVTGAQIKTLANTSAVRATTTTSEAILNSDQNKLVTFTNASAVACTIAQAGSGGNFAAGWAVSLKNLGAGTVTCTPSTSTVDGSANFTLTTGQGLDLYSDGTNYFTQAGKAGGSGTVTTTGSPANGNLAKFSGSSSITNGDLTGDCTTSGALALTCSPPHPGYQTNWFYVPVGVYTAQTGTGSAANTIMCSYGMVPKKVTISQLGVRVATAGSTNLQIAIYANNGGNPGTLISNTANIANTAGATVVSANLGANKQVGPGGADGASDLWFCMNNGDSTASFNSIQANSSIMGVFGGTATLANILGSSAVFVGHRQCSGAACAGGSSTLGTWPASLAGTTWSDGTPGIMPVIFFKVASSP